MLKEQRYAELARSMRIRGWWLLGSFGLAALFFLLNAMLRGVQYLEASEPGHLTALGMWSVAALLSLIYGSRYFGRLRRAAGFFGSKTMDTPEDGTNEKQA